MKTVKFLVDYRGVLTGEKFFKTDETAVFDDAMASALIDAGRAELVQEPEPEPVEKTTTTKRTRRTRKKAT